MSWWEGILLGLIQGIAEWLPISSSGHLAIIQQLLTLEVPLIFDILLHGASLLVILVVFWRDILAILKGILRWDRYYVRLVLYLIIASIPIAIIGIFLENAVEATFSNMTVVGVCFLITSGILFASKFPVKKTKELTFLNITFIGIAQAASILPGLSRSGATNGTGQILGVKPIETGRFAFLLAIPAIGGSILFKIHDIGQITDFPMLLSGFITTFIVGILSLQLILRVLHAQKLHFFSIYCFIIGILVLILTNL